MNKAIHATLRSFIFILATSSFGGCDQQPQPSVPQKPPISTGGPKPTSIETKPAPQPSASIHPPDWPCACDGTPIPAPVVMVPTVSSKSGWPAVMPDRSTAANCATVTSDVVSGFDTSWTIPDPAPDEVAAAPKELQDAMKAIQALPKTSITESEIYKIVPSLKSLPCYRWSGSWTIDTGVARTDSWSKLPKESKPQVFVGATFIKASLTQIGTAEMNFAAYVKSEAGKDYTAVYPVNGSYCTGSKSGCPFLRIDVFYAHPGVRKYLVRWCSNDGVMHLLKHCRNGRFTVDSYADPRVALSSSSYDWNAGRDTYYLVCDENGNFVGWFIVTMYTLSIHGCRGDWAGEDICPNLTYMREQAILEK